MIVKIFKIETSEMCTIHHKSSLIKFIEDEIGISLSDKMTINQLIKYLPVEKYYRVK